jgi:DNA repair exonuclease SbcCD nuclease subunit/ABC-type dipeptide/oligopeptide/nickel transport system ATPase subunit
VLKIAHLSDTQIRNFKRHKEYKESYDNLYASLRQKGPDVIVVVGDIAHTKTQISPEFVDLCADYFRNLSNIAPLVIIPGNHDGNLNNLARLDALSPIIQALNRGNIYYFKHSGVFYHSSPINFVVFSCFDNDWPTKEQIPKDAINIGLFHGMVNGAILQNGQEVQDSPHKLNDFLDKVDYLMLGDIHKMQILDMDYRAAYCGSYPQQNYGESVDKGYLLWTIRDKTDHDVDFVKLPNVCPYYTIDLPDDLTLPATDYQKKARIRVFSRPLTVFEKKNLSDKINQLYDPVELVFLDDKNVQRQQIEIDGLPGEKIENIADVFVQEKLIREFLKNQNLPEESLQKIFEINKTYNVQARSADETFRNVQYRLGKMTFHNMFSYGENNEFDFSRRKGVVGIFGKNAVGKSSLVVDIPLYCIFNKISKKGVVRNDLIVNENKEDCGAEIEIGVGSDLYKIRRATHLYIKNKKTDPTQMGKTVVEFEIHKPDGTVQSEVGEDPNTTNGNIRKTFGLMDDFVATSIAPQWQLLGIIDAGATNRQKLIGRYFDIDIFAQKHKLANDDWKAIKGQLKLYDGRNFEEEEKTIKESFEKVTEKLKDFAAERASLLLEKTAIDKQIENTQVFVVKKQNNLKSLELQLQNARSNLDRCEMKIKGLQQYKCISNPDCCFRDELKEYSETSQEHKRTIEELTIAIENEKKNIEQAVPDAKLIQLKGKKSSIETRLSFNHQMNSEASRKLGSFETSLKEIESARLKYEEIRKNYEMYEHFLNAMSKDGIVKNIIADNLDIVNAEIKKILSVGVGFNIELESEEDGKAIEIYFHHEKSKKRRIEICSGMEKTIAAIAIRAALMNVTTLPRANVFILDEVFTALDPEYMDAISKILDYLKQLFESVIIITHIDSFKDLVDHVVEIVRDDEGFSKICQ